MRVIVFFIAGVTGMFLVKAFLFDNVELVAWNIFWTSIGNVESNFFTVSIFKTNTFLKSFFGFCIVGFVGVSVYNYIYEKNQFKKRK